MLQAIHPRARCTTALIIHLLAAGPAWWAGTLASLADLPAPWRFVTALPQGNDLFAAWSPGPDQLFAGGHGGVLLHWNGSRWSRLATPTQKTIFAIHGRSATDFWAVGGDPYTDVITNRCLILHYNGTSWKEYAAPQFGGYTYPFNAVHAVATNDVWATQDGGTFLAHYDGTKWDWVSVPLAVEGVFRAVTALGPDHLYVAGTHGQILHRDRGVWKLERKTETGGFSTSILKALWAHSPEHVFAAGNWTQFLKRQADGTWTQLPVGPSQPFGFGFLNVWGTSPTNLYLFDAQGVFHSDGLHPATRTNYELSMRRQWYAACGAGDRLYGVGPAGVAHEYLLDGTGGGALSPLTVGGSAELELIFNGAAACGERGLIAYGTSFAQPGAFPLWYLEGAFAQRWPALPPGMSTQTAVKAVIAADPRDIIIAWENLSEWGRGVHRWNGESWQAMPGAEGTVAFSRSPAGRLFAAAPFRVQFWNGSNNWTLSYTVPPDQPETLLNALWAKADNEVFVGTRNGKVLRFDGASWKTEPTPSTDAITGIAGTATDTYAVGEHGLAWRRVGASWQQLAGVALKPEEHFTALAVGPDGVYAAQRTPAIYTGGGLGRIWRFQGPTAALVVAGLSQPLEGLVRSGAGHLIGIAPRDFIITTAPDDGDAPTLKRLNLDRTDWQAVGDTGVSLRAGGPSNLRPVVAVQRIHQPLPLDETPAAYGEHWLILEDRFHAGTSVPPMYVQVHYDPTKLSPELSAAPLSLYRVGDSKTEVAAVADAFAHTLTTLDPVDFSAWTIGRASPPAALTAARAAVGQITLAWPLTAAGFRLISASELGQAAVWKPVNAPLNTNGALISVTLDAASGERFFRLVK